MSKYEKAVKMGIASYEIFGFEDPASFIEIISSNFKRVFGRERLKQLGIIGKK